MSVYTRAVEVNLEETPQFVVSCAHSARFIHAEVIPEESILEPLLLWPAIRVWFEVDTENDALSNRCFQAFPGFSEVPENRFYIRSVTTPYQTFHIYELFLDVLAEDTPLFVL